MNAILRFHRKFQDLINNFIAAALAVLLLVILLQTFTRYVIFYSLPWSEELSRYLYVLLILMGINIGVSQDGFVRIDIIDYFISDRVKRLLALFREAITLFVSSVFLYSTLGMIKVGAFQKSPAMQIRMRYIYMALFAGFALCVLAAVLKLVGRLAEPVPAPADPANGGNK